MSALKTGTVQKVTVLKKITEGFILAGSDTSYKLPNENNGDHVIEIDQTIDVFLYQDRNGEVIATRTIPDIRLDAFGWAEVTEVVPHLGVFVHIGIEKDILVSKDSLPMISRVWPSQGDWLFVSLERDKKGRLLAEPITEHEVQNDLLAAPTSLLNEWTTGRVYRATKAGSFILTEEGYRGFIHPTERKQEPRLGETIEGRVIAVKEDGTINISLLPLKQEKQLEDAEQLVAYLEKHGGSMSFDDKSDPEDIREAFNMSKASFKRALGKLMKEDRVRQNEGKTMLK
ncbi:S1 RNA-binding domain-containing protein [Thalassobacillus sp. CUG 92003]|uniref:CvfB family protein n=1 Tax=Thalassobacillus sp. CUG 92003 TaxID=2736641 RepID=UPI0015E62DD4|nr:S1-like domain-containing RNA-binding protein [Thalassobacillus sp. CUG 92003]